MAKNTEERAPKITLYSLFNTFCQNLYPLIVIKNASDIHLYCAEIQPANVQ